MQWIKNNSLLMMKRDCLLSLPSCFKSLKQKCNNSTKCNTKKIWGQDLKPFPVFGIGAYSRVTISALTTRDPMELRVNLMSGLLRQRSSAKSSDRVLWSTLDVLRIDYTT